LADNDPTPRTSTLPQRSKPRPRNPWDQTIAILGARAPSNDEVTALRALTRGTATPAQQRRAMTYVLVELCGVGRATFAGEKTHSAAFRSGAQGVGLAVVQIADAVLFRFPTDTQAVPDQFNEPE